MLLEMGKRTVVVSGGASWATDWDKPSRPAAPADETAVRNRRRLCVQLPSRRRFETKAEAALYAARSAQSLLSPLWRPPEAAIQRAVFQHLAARDCSTVFVPSAICINSDARDLPMPAFSLTSASHSAQVPSCSALSVFRCSP